VRYGLSFAIWSKKLHDECDEGYWNPLVSDGDALRLAVKLNILWSADFMHFLSLERFSNQAHDDTVAYRRAITRAAASLAPKE
jgi:hypothetical protein